MISGDTNGFINSSCIVGLAISYGSTFSTLTLIQVSSLDRLFLMLLLPQCVLQSFLRVLIILWYLRLSLVQMVMAVGSVIHW